MKITSISKEKTTLERVGFNIEPTLTQEVFNDYVHIVDDMHESLKGTFSFEDGVLLYSGPLPQREGIDNINNWLSEAYNRVEGPRIANEKAIEGRLKYIEGMTGLSVE